MKEVISLRNVISKEDFIEIIENLKRIDDYQEGLNDFFSKNGAEGYIYQPDNKVSVMMLLKVMFDDEDDLVAWFCCKTEYGKSGAKDYIKDENGKSIDLSTPALLYDYLVG